MPNPQNAKRIGSMVDPKDREFWAYSISQGNGENDLLRPAEEPVSVDMAVTAAAASTGLIILTGGKAPVREGRNILFWTEVTESFWSHPVFDGAGTDLAIEITIVTTLDRRKQITILIGTAQQ